MNCSHCNINNGKFNDIFNKNLCKYCLEFDEYKLICKSDAISNFLLKDIDIDELNYIEVINPRFKCASRMKLYSNAQVENIFFEKYDEIIKNNNIENNDIGNIICIIKEIIKNNKNTKKNILLEKLLLKMNITRNDIPESLIKDYLDGKKGAKTSIENIKYKKNLLKIMNDVDPKLKNNINDEKMDEICKNIISGKYTEREIIISLLNKKNKREELNNELDKYNLKIRNDSILCERFINGDETYLLNELVYIMVEMDWYYKYTNYSKIIKNLYDNFFYEQKKYGNRNYYEEFDENDKMEISKNAKKIALKNWNKDGKLGFGPPDKKLFT
jgi:hypothetical protein